MPAITLAVAKSNALWNQLLILNPSILLIKKKINMAELSVAFHNDLKNVAEFDAKTKPKIQKL
ncbi:MAG: hypothetical protein HC797_05210 [Anaerolineales bacterium]|nr:hypothetical protein [Anaerolineales bacterium]